MVRDGFDPATPGSCGRHHTTTRTCTHVDSPGQIRPYIMRSGPPCVVLLVGMVTCHLYASKNRYDRQKRFEEIYIFVNDFIGKKYIYFCEQPDWIKHIFRFVLVLFFVLFTCVACGNNYINYLYDFLLVIKNSFFTTYCM